MKKIIAAAVTAAFVAPAFAADVTMSGSQEFNYQDNNGTTTAEIDGDFNVGASTRNCKWPVCFCGHQVLMMRVVLTAQPLDCKW